MKKLITFATAASLLVGSMVTPVYAAAFVDINTVTWDGFKPFLEQAADLGLMKGYDENGKKYCKPRNNVTYCEAVQLMYSIMKVYTGKDVSDTTVTKWKTVMSAYNIPDWAYKATAYALENSILSIAELPNLQGNASKINTKAATREAVGMIFGKAMDTVNGYDIKSNAALTYADKGSVSSAAVPYLELLNRAGLMVGDTDNKFNPKANISRAEMAVLSVKTYNKLTEGGFSATTPTTTATTAAGTVATSSLMQNGDLFLTVTTTTNTTLSLFGTKGEVTPKYNGSAIDFDDIGTGDTVRVSYTGTTLTALEVVYSKAGISGVEEDEKDEDTTEETYELKEISSSKVYVLDGSKEKSFRLDKDVKVTLDGKKSSVSKLEDALEDAAYDVTLTLDKDEYVLEIDAVLNDNNPTEGYVDDVDEDEIVIKVGTKKYTYSLADDVEIEYDGKTVRFSKFEDEYEDYNYYVTLELSKKGEVEEIIIEYMEDEYSGILTYINSNRIEIEAGG
ncbi:MAG: S-layer homology domain-containing protein [Anaerotignum sp.]|nr:S-layer homology domain-containing protein [Anaerotignum sp.]